jgi:hypothetical protein
MDKLTNGVEDNRRHVTDVELNLAFLSGQQWVRASISQGILPIENETNETRVVDNRMIQVFQWKLHQQFRQRPVLTAFGSGSELIDEERAAVASRLADHWRENNGWEEAEKQAAQWLEVGGAAFLSPVWRSKPGLDETIEVPKFTGVPRVDEKTKQITFTEVTLQKTRGGDIAYDVWNTLQTFTFPRYESDWNKVTGVLTADLVDYDWARHHLRIDINEDGLNPVHAEDINLSALDRLRRHTPAGFSVFNNDFPVDDRRYLLLQWRQRPNPDFPKGRFVITLGDRLIHDDVLPYFEEARAIDPNDEHNWTMGIFPWFAYDIPGLLIPQSPMTILRDHQIRINDLKTDEAQNRKSIGRNKIFYDEGMIDDEAFTNEHGEMIPMQSIGGQLPVNFVQGQPLVGINQEITRAEQAFDDASGRPALFRGDNPPQVRSAFHLDILREEAQTAMSAFIRGREEFHQNVGKMCLEMARRRYSQKRIIDIFGKDKAGMALTYKSAKIYTDIIVKEGSALPRNKAAKEAKALELFRSGAFDGPNGQKNVNMLWEMLELGTLNRSISSEQKQRNRARFENRLILLGEIERERHILPLDYEDHALHIEVHEDEMASPEFYNASPERRALYETHIDMHHDFLAEQQAPESKIPPDGNLGIEKLNLQNAQGPLQFERQPGISVPPGA